MSLVETYLSGLNEVLPPDAREQLTIATGADAGQLAAIRDAYPACPDSLLELWSRVDGTYWRTYGDTKIAVRMLGADVDNGKYPYYLLSTGQALNMHSAGYASDSITERYGDCVQEDPDIVDARIDPNVPMSKRLCFSHCMNNGGTSVLYVDFDPAAGGKVGQVMRFLHDPDSYAVIAESFDVYLQQLIKDGYRFVFEDE